ncbi:ruBisCO large subunit-binding protein subunit beta, chloroplastic [Gossypium australe]|uniref:RuBisCO large subunit-binding protein subunit beta, chloroplastic n=1 Tax=Gossypium australe TaxID=47621 RepID=A0A5B6VDV0_9ROSI|nr:ruBisCO large subunit-binding protein subunit beta, chloroplastic [Gossypium australe]
MAQEAGVFPKSLKSYVQRALALCKDEKQSAACQEIMKEVRLQLVIKCCLEHTTSVAKTFLMSCCLVVEIKEPEPVLARNPMDNSGYGY